MNGKVKVHWKQQLSAWAFMAPALLILGVFTFYPILCGAGLSFCDFSLMRYTDDGLLVSPQWCGLENFRRIGGDRYFWMALKHSLLYLLVVPVLQLSAILVALALSESKSWVNFLRTALYVPVVTSAVCVGIIWRWCLRSDGLLNCLWQVCGGDPIPWLTDPNWALFSVMLVTLWQGIGYYMIIYLAGLQSIPADIAEAARLDGADSRQVFYHITLPLLKPSMALCTMLSCISAIKVFTEIYVMTGGGPRYGTLTLAYYIYTQAFENFNMGYAAAIAMCLALVVGAISLVNYFLFRDGGLKYY